VWKAVKGLQDESRDLICANTKTPEQWAPYLEVLPICPLVRDADGGKVRVIHLPLEVWHQVHQLIVCFGRRAPPRRPSLRRWKRRCVSDPIPFGQIQEAQIPI